MEVKMNTELFVWTEIKVELNKKARTYRVVPLEEIYPIELDDTTDVIRECFENDLINGSGDFLVHIWDAEEEYYTFEVIMKTTDPDEFYECVHPLAEMVIDIAPIETTVMTLEY